MLVKKAQKGDTGSKLTNNCQHLLQYFQIAIKIDEYVELN
jgi:hypothetical protein